MYANSAGFLVAVVVQSDSTKVVKLQYTRIGIVSTPSSMVYLNDGIVYIASEWGNSQLIRLLDKPTDEEHNFVEVLEDWENIGPIQDMAIVDLDRLGQCQVVTCSGVAHTGALSILREGMGVEDHASIEMPGVCGMWSLK
eukprot:UN26224